MASFPEDLSLGSSWAEGKVYMGRVYIQEPRVDMSPSSFRLLKEVDPRG